MNTEKPEKVPKFRITSRMIQRGAKNLRDWVYGTNTGHSHNHDGYIKWKRQRVNPDDPL